MKSFAKQFLNEDFEGVPGAPHVFVGAFGKHPAWNDHMDDIGLVTESLVEAKRSLYIQGISSQIDAHVWERLGEKAVPNFDHVFLWHRPNETLIGLLWSSRDGKGRHLYPMIVCAQVVGQTLDWIWSEALGRLEATAETCRKAASQREVIVALNGLQEALRRRSQAAGEPNIRRSDLGVTEWLSHFAADQVGLQRICHHLAATGSGGATGADEAACRAIRLPTVPGATAAKSLNAWLRFLAVQIDPFWPVLLMMPRSANWLDAVVGEPSKDAYFRLRAAPAAEPVVSTIPYTFTGAANPKMTELIGDVAAGRLPRGSFITGMAGEEAWAAACARLRGARKPSAKEFFSRLLNRN